MNNADFMNIEVNTDNSEKKVFDMATDAKELVPYIEEAILVKEKMEILRSEMKDIKSAAKDALGIKPKQFNQVLNMRFNRNRSEVESQNEEILELYDAAFPENKS